MPRNEFLDHDREEELPPEMGCPEGEGGGQLQDEDASVVADPHLWPVKARPTLADLRKGEGGSTTRAHIAELYGSEDQPLS